MDQKECAKGGNPEVETENYIKMDYNLESPAARIEKINEIIANTPSEKLTPKYLEKMGDYIIDATMDKQEKKQKNILTDNQMITINKREVSFEGLAGKLENGEDGIYGMIANDKNILFTPKKGFTQEEIDTIPGLQELQDSIKKVNEEFKQASGKRKYALKKQIIQMQQDQYELKKTHKPPIHLMNASKTAITDIGKNASKINLDEIITLTEEDKIISSAVINLYDWQHVSLLLCNYSDLKENCWDKFNSDMKWLMEDLDNLIEETLREDYPLYYDLLIYKIDGKSNVEIRQLLFEKHNILHTVEYISSLWRNKIPKLLAGKAGEKWIDWHFTMEEKGVWKKCSRCGQIKLANSRFFSKNKASKDHFYSICKECRNKKK